jgi:hypothetical protein
LVVALVMFSLSFHLVLKLDHGAIVFLEPRLHEFGFRHIKTPLYNQERVEVLFGSIGSRLSPCDLFGVVECLLPDNAPQNEAGVIRYRGR